MPVIGRKLILMVFLLGVLTTVIALALSPGPVRHDAEKNTTPTRHERKSRGRILVASTQHRWLS
jgi:hypothetical protein